MRELPIVTVYALVSSVASLRDMALPYHRNDLPLYRITSNRLPAAKYASSLGTCDRRLRPPVYLS